MPVRHPCRPGGRITGDKPGFTRVFVQDHLTRQHQDEFIFRPVPVAQAGGGAGRQTFDMHAKLGQTAQVAQNAVGIGVQRHAQHGMNRFGFFGKGVQGQLWHHSPLPVRVSGVSKKSIILARPSRFRPNR